MCAKGGVLGPYSAEIQAPARNLQMRFPVIHHWITDQQQPQFFIRARAKATFCELIRTFPSLNCKDVHASDQLLRTCQAYVTLAGSMLHGVVIALAWPLSGTS
jgi:hypothetical protein